MAAWNTNNLSPTALGMESRRIPDDAITASSKYDSNHAPYMGRLNNKKQGAGIGAWVPQQQHGGFNGQGMEWIQVHLPAPCAVTAITTQGRPADYDQYVTSYNVRYSNDGHNFVDVGQTFMANRDTYTPMTNNLPFPITAPFIRLYPMTWNIAPTIRFELLGQYSDGSNYTIDQPLGMESRQIPDLAITASSMYDRNHAPCMGRLNNKKAGNGIGAWVTQEKSGNFGHPGSVWMQICLPTQAKISAIITQGRPADYDQYVTSYNIKYSNDGLNFVDYGQTFRANQNTFTPVTNRLPTPIIASYIRIYPMSWNIAPTIRVELLGHYKPGLIYQGEQALGMENLGIPDDAVTASSMYDLKHAPCMGRLNSGKSESSIGAWVPKQQGPHFINPGTEWIQIQLPPSCLITAITTQGRPADYDQYVTSYIIKYSNNGVNFVDVGKTFGANRDTSTPVTNRLPQPISASFIRIYPMTWNIAPTMRIEVLGHFNGRLNCAAEKALGMENLGIPDNAITASSMYDRNHAPYFGRLNTQKAGSSVGAWVPKQYGANFGAPGTEWIQIQLRARCNVTAIVTQGRPADYDQYVTSYNIKYSNDGTNFVDVGKTFIGNQDTSTPVMNRLPFPITASFIRLYPMSWNIAPTIRVELLGLYNADLNFAAEQALGMENLKIPDSSITASSMYDSNHAPHMGRLNNKKTQNGIGAWVVQQQGGGFGVPGNNWIQIALPSRRYVTAIVTQGRPADYDQYVTSYNIKYSNDGFNFFDVGQTFNANCDTNTPVTNRLPKPIAAKYLRLYPMTWNIAPTLRMEILGNCLV